MSARPPPARKRRDIGRALAVLFCVLFALVGAVPLLLGVLVRTSFVRGWVADETATLVTRELGLSATYTVEVEAWPMMVALSNVTVEASDGGIPFLTVERIAARPRPFSLLAGRIDVGEVEIDRPWIRAVVEDGKLANLAYRLPESDAKPSSELPFTSLAVTEARVDLTVDGARLLTEEVDADVSAEDGGAIEAALRAGGATLRRTHPMPDYPSEDAVDEDRICKLEARARIDGGQLLVRRLQIAGSLDFDPDPDTLPACTLPPGDWRAFDLSLSAARVTGLDGGQLRGAGHVRVKAPPAVVHRFAQAPHLTGSVILDADVEYDGGRLPLVTGSIEADYPGADGKVFSEKLRAKLAVTESLVRLNDIDAIWGSGKVAIAEATVEPFNVEKGRPLRTGPVEIHGIDFPDLIRDLGVHPQATVGWTLREVRLPSFGGTLEPLKLEGQLTAQTEDFQVFDRSARRQGKRRMIGLPEALLKGTFAIRPEGVAFQGFTVDSPRSHIDTSVLIEFKNRISLDVGDGTHIDLAEVGPLVDIDISGIAKVKANMRGSLSNPKLLGELSVSDFVFGGLPIGQVESAKAEFEPLKLTLTDVRVRKNTSFVHGTRARFAFDEGPAVLVDMDLDTLAEPHLEVHDLLDVFQIDKITHDGRPIPDPRWTEIRGRAAGNARVHFVVGGREDRCGTGLIRVNGSMKLLGTYLYGERYPAGNLDFDLVWDDRKAGVNGMSLDVHSAILQKGEGTITASASIRHGGVLRAHAIASGIPIGSLDLLGDFGKKLDGTASAVARIGGTLDAITGLVDVEVSRIGVWPETLQPSRLTVELVPKGAARKSASAAASTSVSPIASSSSATAPPAPRRPTCKGSPGAQFEYTQYLRDETQGDYVVNGSLFGDQIQLRDVEISQQRAKDVRGAVDIKGLDLAPFVKLAAETALAGDAPGTARSPLLERYATKPPDGSLSASLDLKHVYLTNLSRSDVTLSLSGLTLADGGQTVKLLGQTAPITLASNMLSVPGLKLEGRLASGFSTAVVLQGRIAKVLTTPTLDLRVGFDKPLSLAKLSADIPGVERASGVVNANLRIQGPTSALNYSGAATLDNGELYVKGLPVGLTDVQVDIAVGGGEARIRRANAKLGAGTLAVTGSVPIHGFALGTATGHITAKDVRLPVAEGVELTADAELDATLPAATGDDEQRIPDVTGTVQLTSFSYTRPIELAVNLGQLGARQRTTVETYDPKNDSVHFDLNVVSPRPLRFANNLVDMLLEVVDPGLALEGTNQRFGARGLLRIRPESKLRLRNTEFEVREGTVRFDDPHRVAPKVDVRATAEYRRSTTLTGPATSPDTGGSSSAQAAQSAQSGGLWRIGMHAYGNAEALKVDLTSDPGLRQEDIILLLTLGLTRAEIDQGLASSVGETVGLEALSALTGADKAVKKIVPLIDEFRFGTAYSQRTGRTQPMVTVGKRITDSVRATVTTGVTENREVRSTIEWRLDKGVSIQGSYDNSSDTFGLPIGNLGADLRWRIEFE